MKPSAFGIFLSGALFYLFLIPASGSQLDENWTVVIDNLKVASVPARGAPAAASPLLLPEARELLDDRSLARRLVESPGISGGSAGASPYRMPLGFQENRGQIADDNGKICNDVLYTANAEGAKVFFTRTGTSSVFVRREEGNAGVSEATGMSSIAGDDAKPVPNFMTRQLNMTMVDCMSNATITYTHEMPGYANFYLAHCPDGIVGVKSYRRIQYSNIFENVDLVYIADESRRLKYEFIVAPWADPSVIRMKYEGADFLHIDCEGNLHVRTGDCEEVHEAPYAYTSDGTQVECGFRIDGDEVSFGFGEYDRSEELIIDPWVTYCGGSQGDVCYAVAASANGGAVMFGCTYSTDYPVSTGAQQSATGGGRDLFVTKFDAGGGLLWSTYYGGSGDEHGTYGMGTADASGNVVIVGHTSGTSFPVSTGAYQPASAGGDDVCMVKLDSGGARVWATYYGGDGTDTNAQVTTDGNGNVIISGGTSSTNLPMGASPFQSSFAGGVNDAFIAKFTAGGGFIWATYYGGSGFDPASAIARDGAGNVIVAGRTNSLDFPVSAGAFQGYNAGSTDAYLVKFDGNGTRLWATYLGGSSTDAIYGTGTDGSGNILLAGQTMSSNFPVTAGAFQGYNAGIYDGFLAKFDPGGARLWASYFGGTGMDFFYCCVVDGSGNLIAAGNTSSSNFPTSNGALHASIAGSTDACLVKFDASGARLWATYYGGSSDDFIYGVAADQSGNILFGGDTSGSIPTFNPYQSSNAGGLDAILGYLNSAGGIPVEFSAFSAARRRLIAELRWRTESETNNVGFEVQRSFESSAGAWDTRGFVAGGGTTVSAREYSFMDELPPGCAPGQSVFYRLVQRDADGTSRYSPVAEAFPAAVESGFVVHSCSPQPARDEALLRFSLDSDATLSFTLHDALGRAVAAVPASKSFAAGEHTERISCTEFPPGLYFLYIHGAERNTVLRLAVQR
jgi:hypothetical protein